MKSIKDISLYFEYHKKGYHNVAEQLQKTQRQSKSSWVRIMVTVVVIILVVIAILFDVLGVTILAVLGVLLALFQWLYPLATEKADLPVPTSPMVQSQQNIGTPSLINPVSSISSSDTTVPATPMKPSLVPNHTDIPRESQTFASKAMQKDGKIPSIQSNAVFLFNERLSSYEECYGRVRERKTLVSRTFRGVSTSIVGPRRIGKTWLVDYLRLVAPNELGSRFRIAYVDATLTSCATVAGFTAKVLEELDVHTFIPDHSSLDLTILDRVVQDLKAKNQTPILCIDEFEGFGNRQAFDLSFFNGLRALTQYGLGLVVTSKSPLIDIIGDYGKSSGFFNVFEQVKLKPFTRQEAEAFIQAKGSQAHFTQQECSYLLKYGQGGNQLWPPLRLQLVGKLLLEDKILAAEEGSDYYRPENSLYWQEFEERLSEKYRVVMR